eukprot:scaffold10550_cov271-Chaetoceros_neogracile.AAC.53
MFFITQLTIENKIHPATPVTFYSVRKRVVQLPYLSRNTPNGPLLFSSTFPTLAIHSIEAHSLVEWKS